mgnify:CR=1 FL=1
MDKYFEAIASLLTSAQIVALHKALSPLVSRAKANVDSGQHKVSVTVNGRALDMLLSISVRGSDYLKTPPYKELAIGALGKLNQSTIDSIVEDASDPKWKPAETSAIMKALRDIQVNRDRWTRGSRTTSVSADKSAAPNEGQGDG